MMKTKVIKTESEYAAALARIEKLMDAKPTVKEKPTAADLPDFKAIFDLFFFFL